MPDSLRAENNYLLGQYFNRLEKVDSASIYFHDAIDYTKGMSKSIRFDDYFYYAWNAHYTLNRFADCISISTKLKSLLNENEDLRFWNLAYFMEENAYIQMNDFKKL